MAIRYLFFIMDIILEAKGIKKSLTVVKLQNQSTIMKNL